MKQFAQSEYGTLPVTESVAARTLALPFHGNLRVEEIDRVVDVLSTIN